MSNLIHQRCSNHPGREAAVRCPECGRFFCRECVTEHLGRMMCAGCVSRLAVAADESKRRAPLLWLALALLGFLFAWLIFYYLGMGLARIPSTFFAGIPALTGRGYDSAGKSGTTGGTACPTTKDQQFTNPVGQRGPG